MNNPADFDEEMEDAQAKQAGKKGRRPKMSPRDSNGRPLSPQEARRLRK